jgi:hypothetical protein
VYTNTVLEAFPGAWQLLAANIPPVLGPNAMAYVHDDGATSSRRFYLVISECGVVVAASAPLPKRETPIAR